MANSLKTLYFIALQSLICANVGANPDVSFTDSGVYLKHELKGDKIKFLLSHDLEDFQLPDEFFGLGELVSYIDKGHEFTSPELKLEFVRMLRRSIESQFTLKEFLTELIAFLDGLKRNRAQGEDSCTLVNPHSQLLFLAVLVLLRMLRWKGSRR